MRVAFRGPETTVESLQVWERRDGSRFTIDHVDAKFAYYWLATGSKAQYRNIRLDRLKKHYRRVVCE